MFQYFNIKQKYEICKDRKYIISKFTCFFQILILLYLEHIAISMWILMRKIDENNSNDIG